MRKKLGVEKGGQLIADLDGDTVRLTPPDHALVKACALFRRHVPKGGSVVDEVMQDRRAESESELAEAAATKSAKR